MTITEQIERIRKKATSLVVANSELKDYLIEFFITIYVLVLILVVAYLLFISFFVFFEIDTSKPLTIDTVVQFVGLFIAIFGITIGFTIERIKRREEYREKKEKRRGQQFFLLKSILMKLNYLHTKTEIPLFPENIRIKSTSERLKAMNQKEELGIFTSDVLSMDSMFYIHNLESKIDGKSTQDLINNLIYLDDVIDSINSVSRAAFQATLISGGVVQPLNNALKERQLITVDILQTMIDAIRKHVLENWPELADGVPHQPL